MPRKKKDNSVDDLVDIFTVLPVWVPLVLAAFLVVLDWTFTSSLARVFWRMGTIVVLSAGALGAFRRLQRRALAANTRTIEHIRALSCWDFERLVGQAYREAGWRVEERGGAGPDGGVDLTLRREREYHLVQCKQWRSSSVGVKVVREMYGVMHHESAQGVKVVTCGRFSVEAKEFAVDKPIDLVDGATLLAMLNGSQPVVDLSIPAEPKRSAGDVTCPRCGKRMVLRTAKRGSNAGDSYYGCSEYPRCRGIVPINTSPSKLPPTL